MRRPRRRLSRLHAGVGSCSARLSGPRSTRWDSVRPATRWSGSASVLLSLAAFFQYALRASDSVSRRSRPRPRRLANGPSPHLGRRPGRPSASRSSFPSTSRSTRPEPRPPRCGCRAASGGRLSASFLRGAVGVGALGLAAMLALGVFPAVRRRHLPAGAVPSARVRARIPARASAGSAHRRRCSTPAPASARSSWGRSSRADPGVSDPARPLLPVCAWIALAMLAVLERHHLNYPYFVVPAAVVLLARWIQRSAPDRLAGSLAAGAIVDGFRARPRRPDSSARDRRRDPAARVTRRTRLPSPLRGAPGERSSALRSGRSSRAPPR